MRLSFLIGLLPLPALGAPQVLTDMPVTASLVQQVMGDLGEVGILLEQGGDAHDFQLRPSGAGAAEYRSVDMDGARDDPMAA